jgi:hypothetical protein
MFFLERMKATALMGSAPIIGVLQSGKSQFSAAEYAKATFWYFNQHQFNTRFCTVLARRHAHIR